MTQKYPEDSLQHYCGPWWVRAQDQQVRRGRLLWAFVPHVDQHPFILVAEGRSEATEHKSANYRFEPLQGSSLPAGARLPVAGLPHYQGEVRLELRAKRRPAAPYYGADQGGSSGGGKPEFVERIRRCEYPQYMWDKLPLSGRDESILRLDHLQPVGRHGSAYELTDFQLDEEALGVMDEYLSWFLMGGLPPDGIVNDIRAVLLGTA